VEVGFPVLAGAGVVGVGARVVRVGARVACRYMGGFPDWDEWQKKVECRCNIAQDEAYFYTKDIVRWGVGDRAVWIVEMGWDGISTKLAGITSR
jgi:hypothetical protein